MMDSKDLPRKLILCESEVEKLFLLAAYEHIEGLVPQYKVLRYRIDFAIPDKMIAIEIDGHDGHKEKEQRTNDAQRERNIMLELPANWKVVRFTGSEIFQNPSRCVDEVLQFIQKNSPYSISSINEPKIQSRTDNRSDFDWYMEGNRLHWQGKNNEAVLAYDEAVKLNPKRTTYWHAKGNALGKQGKYEDAIKAYDEAIKLDPKDASSWHWRAKGDALREQGKYEDAIKAYDEAIKLDPRNDFARCQKGSALDSQGKYEDAIKAYDEAIRLNPKYYFAWLLKGSALDSQGKYEDAIKAYDEVIRLNPNLAAAWTCKGSTLFSQGKYDEAIQAYEKDIDNNNLRLACAWQAKGDALHEQGKYEDAIKAYDEAIKLDPKYLASTCHICKDMALYAINAYNEANNKGAALMKQRKYDEAIKAYDEALRLRPNLAMAWHNKGLALRKASKFKGLALKLLGRTTEADAAFAKAKKLGYNA